MSNLRPEPKRYANLLQLATWTRAGELMLRLHETFNGHGYPFTESNVWTSINEKTTPYTCGEILASVRSAEMRSLMIKDGQRNVYSLSGTVVSVTVVSPTTMVLVFDGMLSRHTGGERLETAVNVVCCYGLEDGRGFCLLPDRARAELYSK